MRTGTVVEAEATAEVAARGAGVEIRALTTPAETAAATELFAAVWHTPAGLAPVSPDLMRALDHAGNYVVGAYRGDRLVGATVAFFTGDTPPALHSHITGIAPDARSRGAGFALKLHQRAWALARGIGTVLWTTDPLVRRNVFFNLAKLAATVADYLPEFYGPMHDGVNAGDVGDRLLLSWDLASDRVAAASAGRPAVIDDAPGSTGLLLGVAPDGRPVPGAADRPVLRCDLPADIAQLRATDPALALNWRYALREALTAATGDGYRIAGVTRDGSYVLTR